MQFMTPFPAGKVPLHPHKFACETEEVEVAVVRLDCPVEQLDDELLEREALVTLFTLKCCSKDCLLHLIVGHDGINARRKMYYLCI